MLVEIIIRSDGIFGLKRESEVTYRWDELMTLENDKLGWRLLMTDVGCQKPCEKIRTLERTSLLT